MIKPEWRKVLIKRTVKDKIAVPIDCDLAPIDLLPTIAELVREDIIKWIDRANLQHIASYTPDGKIRIGLNCDIYQMTSKGIELCDANDIKGH